MTHTIQDAITKRRSVYALNDTAPLSDSQIVKLIETALSYSPSPYNSRGQRLVVLFGEESREFWAMLCAQELAEEPNRPLDASEKIKARFDSFEAGRGTVLFFNDPAPTEALSRRFPAAADLFPGWAVQANAMLQFAVWTSLADANIGASLQHYGARIDTKNRKKLQVPENWQAIAQMPFGGISEQPEPRELAELSTSLTVRGLSS